MPSPIQKEWEDLQDLAAYFRSCIFYNFYSAGCGPFRIWLIVVVIANPLLVLLWFAWRSKRQRKAIAAYEKELIAPDAMTDGGAAEHAG